MAAHMREYADQRGAARSSVNASSPSAASHLLCAHNLCDTLYSHVVALLLLVCCCHHQRGLPGACLLQEVIREVASLKKLQAACL
jgi:hypothetical protein